MADCENIFKGKFIVLGYDIFTEEDGWVEKLRSPDCGQYDWEFRQTVGWKLPSGNTVYMGRRIFAPESNITPICFYIYFPAENTVCLLDFYDDAYPAGKSGIYLVEPASYGRLWLYDFKIQEDIAPQRILIAGTKPVWSI